MQMSSTYGAGSAGLFAFLLLFGGNDPGDLLADFHQNRMYSGGGILSLGVARLFDNQFNDLVYHGGLPESLNSTCQALS